MAIASGEPAPDYQVHAAYCPHHHSFADRVVVLDDAAVVVACEAERGKDSRSGSARSARSQTLDRVAAYIKNEFSQATALVSEQSYRVLGKSYRNVIAQFGPETPERIVVGAHYDSAGPLPGADDNASGVAGLIELGRLLGRQPPALRVELVAFTLE